MGEGDVECGRAPREGRRPRPRPQLPRIHASSRNRGLAVCVQTRLAVSRMYIARGKRRQSSNSAAVFRVCHSSSRDGLVGIWSTQRHTVVVIPHLL